MMKDQVRTFLLSLLNATLLLAVILTLSVTFLVYKVESAAQDLMSQAGTALLSEAEHEVKGAIASIEAADRDLKQLTEKVAQVIETPGELLGARDIELLKGLRTDVQTTNRLLSEMTSSVSHLSDRTIRQFAQNVAETIISMRNCERDGQ